MLCLVGGPVAALRAADILDRVPRDCAAVVAVRDPKQLADQLNEWAAELGAKEKEPIKAERLMAGFVEAGAWDSGAPAVLVLMRPDFGAGFAVVGFKRADQSQYDSLGKIAEDGSRIRPLKETDGPHGFGTRIGEYVFLSPRRTPLERMVRLEPTESLGASMAPEQRELYARSDVYLHVPMAPWRNRIKPMIAQAFTVMKAYTMLTGDDAEGIGILADWSMSGVNALMEQLEWSDVGGRFDKDGATITHLHRFAPQGSVSEYLAQVRPGRKDLWGGLPDVPFMAAMATSWQYTGPLSPSCQLTELMTQSESIRAKLDPEQRAELCRRARDWERESMGMNFIMGGNQTSLPLEMYCTYAVNDADRSLEQLVRLQELGNEAASVFMTGGMQGKLKRRRMGERQILEWRLTFDGKQAQAMAGVQAIYGKSPAVTFARLDDHHVGYTFSSRKAAIETLFPESHAPQLSNNKAVRRIMAKLPDNPHMVVLVDLSQCVRFGMGMAMQFGAPASRPAEDAGAEHRTPTLAAWCMTMAPRTVRGDLFVARSDVAAFIREAEEVGKRLQRPPPEPPAKPPRRAPRRPPPREQN